MSLTTHKPSEQPDIENSDSGNRSLDQSDQQNSDQQFDGIHLNNVTKYFDDVGAANGVSFQLTRGELMALVGPSGCGKTTTLRLIAGFEELNDGFIDICGRRVAATIPGSKIHLRPEKRRVGMVFQEYALFPHLDVAHNVSFGLRNFVGDIDKRIDHVLEMVGLSALKKRMPNELSGGQQQRVALARALAPKPDLILLDEPFSNLDASLRGRLRAEVRNILRQAETTAIFVTHDQEEALSLVDQVAVLIDGVVRQVAAPYQLYQRPADRTVAEFIGEANFLPGIAKGDYVECELGKLPLYEEKQGPVDVLIRPENITISRVQDNDTNDVQSGMIGKNAEQTNVYKSCHVCNTLFFGHDQLITVRLTSGNLLQTRLLPFRDYAVDEVVNLYVNSSVIAYPRIVLD